MEGKQLEPKLSNGNTRSELIKRLPIPGPGAPKLTPAKKLEREAKRKAIKELIANYQQSLADALEKVSPVLIAKALKGDVAAIRELNDRVMGKPQQKTDITSGGKPIGMLLDEAEDD